MEESGSERCCAVYYCPTRDHVISELYHRTSPPTTVPQAEPGDTVQNQVLQNIRLLLDEDWANVEQVFLCSDHDQCLDRLEGFANGTPTIVLIESGAGVDEDGESKALPFLRCVSADVQGARFQHQVLPFVLVASSTFPDSMHFLDPSTTTTYLEAGAIDMVRSPFTSMGLTRVVGHVRERTRPSAHLLGASMARNLVDSIRNQDKARVSRHRPDEFLSSKRKAAIEEAISQWKFPAHQFDMDELTYGALFMLEHVLRNPELEHFRLPRPELMTFLLATRRQYKHEREVHYHNWRHAVDVTQSLYCFLCDVRLCPPTDPSLPMKKEVNAVERILSPVDALTLLISAIGHDVGHPGVNNAFLVACNHPLANLYNDKSVLENYHCAAYSQLLRRHWPALSEMPNFRSTMISVILATDMQRHFEYMGQMAELKLKVERSEPDLEDWSEKDKEHTRELIMSLLIKAADISNVARPFDISAQWAGILMNEFSRQGELESELDIPTCLFGGPPDKEDALAAAQSQKGFMSLFGLPLFCGISDVMPNVSCTLPELDKNQQVWDQRIMDETQRREAQATPSDSSATLGESGARAVKTDSRSRDSEPTFVPVGSPRGPSTPVKRQAVVDNKSSPTRHVAHDSKHHFTTGMSSFDEKRSSGPLLMPNSHTLSPAGTGQSRRSSKDVALHQLQELSTWAHQNLQSDSRRGSVDAGWQLHQSYPGSRRGSKDESLTTILVTSQGSPQRSSTASPAVPSVSALPSKATGPNKASSVGHAPKAATGMGRSSIPSSRSHATSSATATSDPQSPSTQPSSVGLGEDDRTPPAHHSSIAATEDPFIEPGNWPNNYDGQHRVSAPEVQPPAPTQFSAAPKSVSPRLTRKSSRDSTEDVSRSGTRKSSRGLQESRSRSRLRGLKFWKKRRDISGVEGARTESASP